jgi:hypothetical protein
MAISLTGAANAFRRRVGRVTSAVLLGLMAVALNPRPAAADQGGISMWLPGAFGSLAAVPGHPGWSLGTIYLHSSLSADGNVAASRAIRFGNRTANLTVNLDAELRAKVDVGVLAPGYTFAQPVLGGQLAVSLLAIYGRQQATIDANITGALGPIGFATSRSVSQDITAFGDLFPQATLKWNHGVHNTMVYGMMNIPIGAYEPNRLVNLGLGHWAIDGGYGYTYFNPQTGYEFSSVVGLTYNFENTHTDYQNGIDLHWDMGASRFVTKEWQIGVVGYLYQQLTCDSGSGNRVGCFRSRVMGLGPQIGHVFKVSDHHQGYLNLKGYGEFAADHRPEGWNVWLTLVISPTAPTPAPTTRRIVK